MMGNNYPILYGPGSEKPDKHPAWPRFVPWEMVAPHESQAQSNHGQTLKRLAERGGLCLQEMVAVLNDWPWKRVSHLTYDEAAMMINNAIKRHAAAEPEHIEVAPGQCLLCYRSLTYCDCAQPQVAPGQQDGAKRYEPDTERMYLYWQDKRIAELEAALALALEALAQSERELRQERGLKALLANGMPPTGNPDFDKVLATHPIAAMIQRGWLCGVTGFDDLPLLESAICKFYEVATIAEAVNPPWPRAALAASQPGKET